MVAIMLPTGLWISFIQGRTFHDIHCDGEKYIVSRRENSAKDFRREGEKKGTHIPCLHYYHRECTGLCTPRSLALILVLRCRHHPGPAVLVTANDSFARLELTAVLVTVCSAR